MISKFLGTVCPLNKHPNTLGLGNKLLYMYSGKAGSTVYIVQLINLRFQDIFLHEIKTLCGL